MYLDYYTVSKHISECSIWHHYLDACSIAVHVLNYVRDIELLWAPTHTKLLYFIPSEIIIFTWPFYVRIDLLRIPYNGLASLINKFLVFP